MAKFESEKAASASNGASTVAYKKTTEISKSGGEACLPVTEDQFPFKLHKLLEDAERRGFTDTITWSSDGKSFLVLNKHRLEDIMPRYFSSAKFKSFQRSLNLWGFACDKKQYRGPGTRRHHPFFIRGHPELCHGMQRTRVKQPGTRGSLPGPDDDAAPASNSGMPLSRIAIKKSKRPPEKAKRNGKSHDESSPSSISSPLDPLSGAVVPPVSNSGNTSTSVCGQNPLHALVSVPNLEAFARSQAILVAMQQQQQNAFLHAQELAALQMHSALLNGGASGQQQQQQPQNTSLQSLLASRQKEEEFLVQHLMAARARSNLQTALQQQLLSAAGAGGFR